MVQKNGAVKWRAVSAIQEPEYFQEQTRELPVLSKKSVPTKRRESTVADHTFYTWKPKPWAWGNYPFMLKDTRLKHDLIGTGICHVVAKAATESIYGETLAGEFSQVFVQLYLEFLEYLEC